MAGSDAPLVVVGGGIAGLSTAWFLAQLSDRPVTLVEREPRHDAHSSGRSAEIQRVAVPDPVTRALALETDALYRTPEAAGLPAGLELAERVGLLIGHDDERPAWWNDLEGALPFETETPESAARRAPHVRLRARHATWFPTAAQVHRPRLLAALARASMERGVRLVRSAGHATLETSAGRVTGVLLERNRRLPATDVVIAAGAWSRALGEEVGAPTPLRPTRRHMLSFERSEAGPPPPVVWDDSAALYVRTRGPRWLVSPCDLADAAPSARGGDAVDSPVIEEALKRLRDFAPQLMDGRLVESWCGFRDLTPDDRPILGPDPRVPGLAWCASLGGHGMTIGLAAGRSAARAVLGLDDPWSPACGPLRFGS